MRVVYPLVTTMGFGNNVITLAKAHLIAERCGLTYQRPVWPPTPHVPGVPQGYGHYLPWTARDRLCVTAFSYIGRLQRKLGVPPWPACVRFDRADYEGIGEIDVGNACRTYLTRLGLENPARSLVVTTGGMWGGYAAIAAARGWIEQLLLSHEDTRRRYEAIDRAIGTRLRIGVNIRMGDFLPPEAAGTDRQGERLVRLPLEWYQNVCSQLRRVVDCEFVLVSDGTREELRPFLAEFRPIDIVGQPYTALLGLLLLKSCHVVVCSNSTYSRVACFLNDRPYVWPGDTLVRDASGAFGYLWHDNGNPMPAWAKKTVPSGDGDRAAVRRCFALGAAAIAVPEGLIRYVAAGAALPIEIRDDLLYGDPVRLLR
jgi:hypothetical protein